MLMHCPDVTAILGASPSEPIVSVAQLIARPTVTREVGGLSPPGDVKLKLDVT